MQKDFHPNRYAVIHDKNPREIVMLVGQGCAWRKCRFCDYHLDFDPDPAVTWAVNAPILQQITGEYHRLEVINSGSFVDLDAQTMHALHEICASKKIAEIHFESHWMHRHAIADLRQSFARQGMQVKIKIGVESFDALFRESYLSKGIDAEDPACIAAYFDACCLLQGLPGQTAEGMHKDITIGLAYFDRVCVNIMQKNTMPIQPDPQVIDIFVREVLPLYLKNPRVDILMENTAFGVGGVMQDAQ